MVFSEQTKGHNQIRKEIVLRHKLEAVIEMPSGVFKPYAGVSTAILIFTKTGTGGTDNVWFYEMEADGFSLMTPVTLETNDIPDIVSFHNRAENEAQAHRQELHGACSRD